MQQPEPEFDDDQDAEADWWDDAAMANDAPVLSAAADVALALVIQGEQALQFEADIRAGRRTPVEGYALPVRAVPAELVLLVALTLVETVRRVTTIDPMPPEVAARLDQVQSLVHCGEHLGEAVALLDDDTEARAVAAIRPPSPVVMQPPSTLYACHAVATRPPADWGTVPPAAAAELDRLLADPDPQAWTELRTRTRNALEACARAGIYREAGTMLHTLRKLRIRRSWLDQLDREPLVGDEPASRLY